MFFERRCPGCGRLTGSVCAACWGRLSPIGRFASAGVELAIGLYDYDDTARSIVLAAKNGGRRDLLRALGAQLGRAVAAEIDVASIDAVAWVPASVDRRRRRGFDQGRVLARSLGRTIGRPHRSLVARTDHESQFGKDAVSRRLGPQVRARRGAPPVVLLVDDVVTTGASIAAASAALRRAGAERIIAATVAVAARPATGAPTSYCGRTNTSQSPTGTRLEEPRWR